MAVLALGLLGCREEAVQHGGCDDLPAAPLPQSTVPGYANEDLTFDAQGYLVGADNQTNLWRTDRDGTATLVVPASEVNAGLRLMWWDGTLASAQYRTNAIWRIDPETGAREALIGALQTPSGIELGLDHSLWVTELDGDRVQRFDVDTRTLHVVVEGLGRPNGLSFDPSYTRLYVAATGEGHLYAVDIDPETLEAVGEPEVFVADAGEGIDGLSVDACGNVYAAWWSQARIERWAPDGGHHEVLVDEPGAAYGLGNFAWGAAAHGWSPTTIYVVEQGPATVRAIELGVAEKPRPTTQEEQ